MNAQILLEFSIFSEAEKSQTEMGTGHLAADILNGTPDKFSGELCFQQNMDFKQAADLFGGKFDYPEDLDQHGFQTGQSVAAKAALWYRVSDGSFGVAVKFQQDWEVQYGDGHFTIDIVGSIEYQGKESQQYLIGLKGSFLLGKYMVDMSLAFGVGTGEKKIPTLLSITFRDENILLSDFIASVSKSVSYETLPIPENYVEYGKPKQAFDINAKLNLTEQTFLLTGEYMSESDFDASIAVYFSRQEQEEEGKKKDRYVWWVGVQVTDFDLSHISSALEKVNRFLGLENVTAAVILSSDEQEITAVEGTEFIGYAGTVHPGLTFRIDVALKNEFLKEVLAFEGTCSISGYIPKNENEAITLSGHCDSIKFLSFLTLTETDVLLEKQASEERFFFSLSAHVKIEYTKLQLPEFETKLTYEESETKEKVTLEGAVGKPVEEPLGIPSTTLEELKLYAISEKTKRENGDSAKQVYFNGSARIGSLRIVAQIHFIQEDAGAKMSPALVTLTIGTNDKLSISSLVKQYFKFKWPDILDIELYNGRIWYCSKDVTLDGVMYRNGFHAQVDTKIFFLPELMLSIDIGEGKQLMTGARIKNAVELAFIKLYTTEGGAEYGPEMSISVAEGISVFMITTDISIFSQPILSLVVSARKECLEGTLDFKTGLPITGKVTVTINKKGVSLGECSIGKLRKTDYKLPDLNLGKGVCKIKILKNPKLKAVPKVESKGMTMDETKLEAKFDFIIQIKSLTAFSGSGGDDLVELPFTDVAFSADKSKFTKFTFDTFLDIVEDNIANLVETAAEQVISGEVFSDVFSKKGLANIAKFMTIAGISWGINELVSYLICKGLPALLAEWFVSAMTSFFEVLWVGLGFFLGLGGIICSFAAGGTVTIEDKAPQENTEEPEKNPEKPGVPSVFFRNEKLTITWNACAKATGYYPVVARQLPENEEQVNELNLILGTCTGTMFEVMGSDEEDLFHASYGYTYRIKIYTFNDDGASMGDETSIYLLRRPTGFKLRYRCEQQSLTVSWNAVDMARQYEVERVWYEGGEEKQEICTYEPDTREVVYDNLEPDQSVEISVRGTAENVIGPAAGSETLYLYDLKAPTGFQGYDTDDGIALEWEQVLYADRYRISCIDEEGGKIDVPDSYEVNTLIGAEHLQEDVCYTIYVRSMTEEIEGRRSEVVKVLWKSLPIPEIVELICGEDGLMVFVLMSDNVRSRQLVYPDGRAVVLDEQQISCEWDIEENARVRLVDRARHGKWSDEISVKPLPSPQNLKLYLEGEMLRAEWEKAGEDSVYGIEILADSFRQVVEPIETTSWQIPVSDLPGKEIIRVCLYAIDSADQRRRSNAVELSLDLR